MENSCTIQLFAENAWHDAGSVTLLGAPQDGWRAKSYTGYSVEWAVRYPRRSDAYAFASRMPVGLAPYEQAHWPVFLIDMLPQGFGRAELLRRLELPVTAELAADWRLLLAGAGNPIGNLRVKEAAQWLSTRLDSVHGFTDMEVAQRGEDFAEYLASYGLFVAGSSGVQGEWPKVLLTRAKDGLLYLDHTLPDDQAIEHYIVKFGRGTESKLASILQLEAPYMSLAKHLGLRVHAELKLKERALFIPRFDRIVKNDNVIRLAQESIATLTDLAGFDTVPSHDEVCKQIVLHCTDQGTELLEYIKRDITNIALGNKDNHARNTAIQRDFEGVIRLTPLYDFAPMYLHPDGIARRIRWEGNDGGQPDWHRVLDSVCSLYAALKNKLQTRPPLEADMLRSKMVLSLNKMAITFDHIAKNGVDLGLDPEVLDYLRPALQSQVHQLAKLR